MGKLNGVLIPLFLFLLITPTINAAHPNLTFMSHTNYDISNSTKFNVDYNSEGLTVDGTVIGNIFNIGADPWGFDYLNVTTNGNGILLNGTPSALVNDPSEFTVNIYSDVTTSPNTADNYGNVWVHLGQSYEHFMLAHENGYMTATEHGNDCAAAGGYNQILSNTTFSTGKPHLFTWAFDSGTMYFYVDGIEVGSGAFDALCDPSGYTSAIGSRTNFLSNAESNFTEISIYNKALNLSEIRILNSTIDGTDSPYQIADPELLNLTILSPPNNSITKNVSNNIPIKLNIDSNGSGFNFSIYLNGTLEDKVNNVSQFYNYTSPTAFNTEGVYNILVSVIDNNSNQDNQSITLTVDKTPPTPPVLNTPYNTDHLNDNTTFFNWTEPDPPATIDHYHIWISNISDFSILVHSNETVNTNYTIVSPLIDNDYYWRVTAHDLADNHDNSTDFQFTIDTIFPDWSEGSNFKFDNTTSYGINFSSTFDCEASDDNLFRINVSIFNGTLGNTTLANLYIADYNTTTFLCQNVPIDTTSWEDLKNYTVELSATDDHTYGSLRNLTYGVDSNGIRFSKGLTKKVQLVYYKDDEIYPVTAQQILDFNIHWNIIDTGNGEYKYDLIFNRPNQNIKFGFAIQGNDIQVRQRKGQLPILIWKDWYFDFEDMVKTGFPTTYIFKDGYHIFYSDTKYCGDKGVFAGYECTWDPVVGGLNTRTEYYTFFYNSSLGVSIPQPQTPLSAGFGNVSVVIQETTSIIPVLVILFIWVIIIIMIWIIIRFIKQFLNNISLKVKEEL